MLFIHFSILSVEARKLLLSPKEGHRQYRFKSSESEIFSPTESASTMESKGDQYKFTGINNLILKTGKKKI